MKVKLNSTSSGKEPLKRGFTLIEMIGVLAVIAIVATIIVPNQLQQLDTGTSQHETATLQGFGSALQSSICRNFYIPGQNDWVSNIAAEVGLDTNDVATNSRGQPRAFLIDTNFQIGTNAAGVLPYTQYTNGSANQPTSPRLMILSSISTNLPPNVFSGVSAPDFSNIWNTADGSTPTTSFTGWPGSNDLKVQRINLSSLFVSLTLSTSTNSPIPNGQYEINPPTTTNFAPTSGTNAYYIQNTTLRLINVTSTNTNVDSDQILTRNSSFVYTANGVWSNSP